MVKVYKGFGGIIELKIAEHKTCERCNEKETRMDARYCSWCGTAFKTVIITGFTIKETLVLKQIEDVTPKKDME